MTVEPSDKQEPKSAVKGNSSLRDHEWPRFLQGPGSELLEKLYVPALSEAVRYDRCCAYFSSSVLATAARGFGRLIERLLALGASAPRPAVRFVVNEEMQREDVLALTETGDTSKLEFLLLKRLKKPSELLERKRLEMLCWLVKAGLMELRVGVMRSGEGIVHGKFGLVFDAAGDAVVFSGSGNESAHGLRANYERLEISTSWDDPQRFQVYRDEFEQLWLDKHPHVHTLPIPEAVRQKLIKFAPPEPPLIEPSECLARRKAEMVWRFIAEAPYLEAGASSCDATAPVDLWPHQRAVVEETAAAWPDGRLLCDEVGMGKTIEAIMILRRLLAGRGVRRVLLLLPAGLTIQWQEELREKGGLIVPRLEGLDRLLWPDGHNEKVSGLAEAIRRNTLILSRETAKRENHRNVLLDAAPWDLVLLDEAHAARRAKQEEGEFNTGTLLLDLLRQLQIRRKARSFLLLSATPMQTAPWEPWDLLAILGQGGAWLADFEAVRAYYTTLHTLIKSTPDADDARRAAFLIASDPEFPTPPAGVSQIRDPSKDSMRLRFVPPGHRKEVIQWLREGSPLKRCMHRNTRETLRLYHRQGLLPVEPPRRIVVDLPYDFQPSAGPERRLYDAVAEYIENRFEELEHEKPGKGFVMTIYRRRAASSPYALQRSLERRLRDLERVALQRASSGYISPTDIPASLTDADVPDGWDTGSIPAGLPTQPQQAEREAAEVRQLLNQLDSLGPTDTKRDRFYDLIKDLSSDGHTVLVFTEYADTMEYVRQNLAVHYDEQVASFSGDGGAMYRDQHWSPVSKKAITDALWNGTVRFLVCTDAASEGLNLQAASAIINYDLPWNPSKVEQRIGRIDRIGQPRREVWVYNLLLRDSIDEKVYGALRQRCGLFERFVGTMQPVLARAHAMLIRPREFSVEELEQLARQAEENFLNAAAYVESGPITKPTPAPVLSREDLRTALKELSHDERLLVRPETMPDLFTVKGLGRRPIKFGLTTAALEADPEAFPLTVLSPEAKQIAEALARPGESSPLVVGSYQAGAFRASCAFWVTEQGLERVGSFGLLQKRLQEWDGSLPSPERLIEATRHAQRLAQGQVRKLQLQAARREQASINAQRTSARLRLARELVRLLACWTGHVTDLEAELRRQAERGGPLAEKIRLALDRVGSLSEWSEHLKWELERFHRNLAPNEKQSQLTGASLDAALSDYRLLIKP